MCEMEKGISLSTLKYVSVSKSYYFECFIHFTQVIHFEKGVECLSVSAIFNLVFFRVRRYKILYIYTVQ